jgi:hypothetical protein
MDQDPTSLPDRPQEPPQKDDAHLKRLVQQLSEVLTGPLQPSRDLVMRYAGRVTPRSAEPHDVDEIQIPDFLHKQAGGSRDEPEESRPRDRTLRQPLNGWPPSAPEVPRALPDWLEACVQARTREVEAARQANPAEPFNPLISPRTQAMLDMLHADHADRRRELEPPVYRFKPGPLSPEEESEVRARIHAEHQQYAYRERRGADQSDPRYSFIRAGEHLAMVEALQQRLQDAGLAPEVLPDRWSYPYHG